MYSKHELRTYSEICHLCISHFKSYSVKVELKFKSIQVQVFLERGHYTTCKQIIPFFIAVTEFTISLSLRKPKCADWKSWSCFDKQLKVK